MREILFRGKERYECEWVYGAYSLWDYDSETKTTTTDTSIIDYDNECLWVRVIPETVGQFTGIIDKNGKKIFEGDIVRTQPFYDKPYSSKRKGKQFVGVVEYVTHKFNGNKFYSEQIYDAHWRVNIVDDIGKYTHCSWSNFWNCEVIGNIYDNPELLEVK